MQQPPFPTVKYPSVVEGYVKGPLRLESLQGPEIYLTDQTEWNLKDFGPIIKNGIPYSVSHIQYKSHYGWLKMEPDSYHFWWMPRLQTLGKPGSEQGIYIRKSRKLFQTYCWRWDKDPSLTVPWVWSQGYFGGNLD